MTIKPPNRVPTKRLNPNLNPSWKWLPMAYTAPMQAKQAFKAKPFGGSAPYSQSPAKSFGKPSGKGLDYKTGDRVRHIKFGEGTVTAIIEGGRDYEVTVAFDTAGTKKMFAAFAKLEKI